MRRETRKQPWKTFPFWFLVLSGLAMTVAWKLDLLQPQSRQTASDTDPVPADAVPDWANSDVEDGTESAVEGQAEPRVDGQSSRAFPELTESDLASTAESGEPRQASSKTKSSTNSNPFSRTDARLVSAHREKPPSAAFTPSKTLTPAPNPSQASSPKSPFGPAKVEFQGTRPPNSRTQTAKNAAWETEPASPGESSPEITQTASIDPTSGRDAPLPEQAAPRTGNPLEPKTSGEDTEDLLDLSDIDQLIAEGEDVEANFQLSNLYWKRPEIRDQLMKRLSVVAYRIYFAPQPHYMDGRVIQTGDLLQNIAKDYDVSWEYLAKLNRTDAKKIRPGQKLKVIRGPFAAVVDLSDREMTVHSHGHYVARFEVGIGKDSSSPLGTLKVLEKLRDPTYYGPEGVIEHDDPQNPLGEYWLDLGDSYGIHGTIDESSIGQAESQGCIRMKNRDIADVYDLLTPGSEVLIRR